MATEPFTFEMELDDLPKERLKQLIFEETNLLRERQAYEAAQMGRVNLGQLIVSFAFSTTACRSLNCQQAQGRVKGWSSFVLLLDR